MYGINYDPGMASCFTRVALAIHTPRGFHTVRGGIEKGGHRFCSRFVSVQKKKMIIRGWDPIFPGWRLLYEKMNPRLRYPRRAGRYR